MLIFTLVLALVDDSCQKRHASLLKHTFHLPCRACLSTRGMDRIAARQQAGRVMMMMMMILLLLNHHNLLVVTRLRIPATRPLDRLA